MKICSYAWVEAAGQQMFGPRWKGKMANALGVDRKTVERWKPEATVHVEITMAHYLHIRHLLDLTAAGLPIALE